MRNILLTIAYDGTNFSGWQRQPQARTVQGELENVLSLLCGGTVSLNGTSRTDAGVHALGQRASFCGEFGIPTGRIAQATNNLLGSRLSGGKIGDVQILKAEEVPEQFHARFDCKGKTYLYRIRNQEQIDVFSRNYCYQVKEPLDLQAMRKAAEHLIGTHDFRSFMASGGREMETTVRTVFDLEILEETAAAKTGEILKMRQQGIGESRDVTLKVTGDGFLYNMVRILTGTLVEVGLGKREPETLKEIVAARSREKAGHTAPPQGLYLAEIFFEERYQKLKQDGFDMP